MRRLAILLTLLLTACAATGQQKVIDSQPIPPFQIPARQADQSYLDFFAVGDTGTGGAGQKQVAAAMGQQAQLTPPAFTLLLGDNFYELGISSAQAQDWQSKFEAIYQAPDLQVPFYAVLGNHDHLGNAEAQVNYAKQNPSRWKMPARYYQFTQTVGEQSVLFVALDTEPLANPLVDSTQQLAWLEQSLQASTARWKIVYGHHPIYSGGQHGNNPRLIQNLKPILERTGVDLYLAGHDHDQQMLQAQGQLNFVISGAGSKSRDVRWQSNTRYAATNLGFTRFRLSAEELVVAFYDGQARLDFAHTIYKPLSPALTSPQPPVLQRQSAP